MLWKSTKQQLNHRLSRATWQDKSLECSINNVRNRSRTLPTIERWCSTILKIVNVFMNRFRMSYNIHSYMTNQSPRCRSDSEALIWGLENRNKDKGYLKWIISNRFHAGNKRPPSITISWLIVAFKSGCSSPRHSRSRPKSIPALSVCSLRLDVINIYGAHNAARWARPIISPLTALR